MEEEYKSLLASKTFWGAVAGLIVAVMAIFKVDLDVGQIQTALEALGVVASFVLVVWGRVTAKKKIGKTSDNAAKVVLLLLLVPVIGLSVQGCATIPTGDNTAVEENAYKVLLSAKLTYEATMPALAQAYEQGLINEEEKDNIIDGAKKFLGAYRLAVVALAEYVKVKDTAAEERLTTALKDMNTMFGEFLAFVTPYLTKKEGV